MWEKFAPVSPPSPPSFFFAVCFFLLYSHAVALQACSYVNRVRIFGDNLYTPPLSFSLFRPCFSSIHAFLISLCHPLFQLFSPCSSHPLLHSDLFNCSNIYHFLFLLLLDHDISSQPSDPLLILLALVTALFLPFYLIVSLWISFSHKYFFLLLGLFFPLCYTISPSFMLPFIFMLNLPLYICAHSLCLFFCSAPVVRSYEMN